MPRPNETGRPDGRLPDGAEAAAPRQVPADRRARAAVPVQPRVRGLRQDPASRARAAPAHARRAGGRRDRGVRRADGLDRRRRAADPPRDRRDRAPAGRRARSSSTCAPTRCCWRRSSTGSSRRRTSPGPSTSTACASATTSRSAARACSTRRWRRSGRPRPGLPRHHQHDVLHPRLARRRSARCWTSSTTSSRSTR